MGRTWARRLGGDGVREEEWKEKHSQGDEQDEEEKEEEKEVVNEEWEKEDDVLLHSLNAPILNMLDIERPV